MNLEAMADVFCRERNTSTGCDILFAVGNHREPAASNQQDRIAMVRRSVEMESRRLLCVQCSIRLWGWECLIGSVEWHRCCLNSFTSCGRTSPLRTPRRSAISIPTSRDRPGQNGLGTNQTPSGGAAREPSSRCCRDVGSAPTPTPFRVCESRFAVASSLLVHCSA